MIELSSLYRSIANIDLDFSLPHVRTILIKRTAWVLIRVIHHSAELYRIYSGIQWVLDRCGRRWYAHFSFDATLTGLGLRSQFCKQCAVEVNSEAICIRSTMMRVAVASPERNGGKADGGKRRWR